MAEDDDLEVDEEFEEDDEEIELDDEEIGEDEEDAIVADDLDEPLDEVIAEEAGEEEEEEGPGPEVRAKRKGAAGEDEDDEEEEDDPDDVEADLDTILKDRIAAADEEDEDDEEEVLEVVDASGDGTKIQPRRPGEFLCQSCFLVKAPSQLADPKNNLCVDCV